MTTIGSTFTGVGILDAALRDVLGGDVAWQVEIEPYPRRVLELRFPSAGRSVTDVTSPDALSLPHVDVLAGGFPCQDLSLAGRGAGLDGERSGLFFRMADIIEAVQPRVVLIENVAALQKRGMHQVTARLAELGYHVEATRIAASDLGAPHQRMRLLLIAYRGDHLWPVDEHGGQWTRLRPGWWGTVPRWREEPVLVSLWPTPTVKGNHNRAGLTARSGDGLAVAVRQWATPVATGTPGPLNPAWAACLMGWPIGWTDLNTASPVRVARPLPPGPDQHDDEPPRMVAPRSLAHRTARVKAVGNGVDWDVALVGAQRIAAHLA